MPVINSFQARFGDFNKNKSKNQDITIFIHASDIHLGSHQYRNEYRADDFIRAFQEIFYISIIHQADFILLGGDVFTSLEMLPGKLIKIINILTAFRDYTCGTIPIIAIEGNHDIRKFSRGVKFSKRGQSWLKFLLNLDLLILLDGNMEAPPNSIYLPYDSKHKKGGKIQIKNAIIYGNHYLGENPEGYIPKITKAIEKEDNFFNILLQHFGIKGQMKNVPGIDYNKLHSLRKKVDYLALGHYHLQFILDDWVYNPGSTEAACSVDSKFKRGVFIVKITGKKHYEKKVHFLRLINRKHIWKTIYFPYSFKSKENIKKFITNKLKVEINSSEDELDLSNPKVPILYLVLKGWKPLLKYKLNERDLKAEILQSLSLVDVKIFQKFSDHIKKLNEYLKITL
ncbi:MAG: exonuclease SbcCD subunit D [Candidatus Hodarchaeota archaeon]